MVVFAAGSLLLFSTAPASEQEICFQIDHSDKEERAGGQLWGGACSKAHDRSVTDLGMELGHSIF